MTVALNVTSRQPRCCNGWRVSGMAWVVALLVGCQSSVSDPPSPSPSTNRLDAVNNQEVEAFCGACHRLPQPESFAKADWREEVLLGFRLYQESGRTDLRPPPKPHVVGYYESRAPLELKFDRPEQAAVGDRPSPIPFEPHAVHVESATTAPAVARIEAIDNFFLIADMQGGIVWKWRPGDDRAEKLWKVPHPASLASIAIQPDQPAGLLVGDLGTFYPADRHRGALWWASSPGATEVQPFMTKMSRVSHVTAGDLDADGRTDLIISEFGWRKTGHLSIGWNDPAGTPEHPMNVRVLDPRHGCLKTAICDFEGDGKLDIIAAFAQEHETVDRFRVLGERQFERDVLYRAPDPTWGTSDFEVVDLDQDGRLDIVVCHGDSFDGGSLRPYHGIRWLRQLSDGTVEMHLLAGIPGVHRAVPADLDLDGDLDLVAVALLPSAVTSSAAHGKLASVVWLEQIAAGEFVPHVLEWDRCEHATCLVTDEDHDGDVDLVVGHFHGEGHETQLLTVFRNGLRQSENKSD